MRVLFSANSYLFWDLSPIILEICLVNTFNVPMFMHRGLQYYCFRCTVLMSREIQINNSLVAVILNIMYSTEGLFKVCYF